MAIDPKTAADEMWKVLILEPLDRRVAEIVEKEEARIDRILLREWYTGGPPVELDAPDRDLEDFIVRQIMRKYNEAGWKIELPANHDARVWRFSSL